MTFFVGVEFFPLANRSVRVPHGSHQRTWPEKDGRSPTTALDARELKTIEKRRIRRTYAGANMGHPDRVVYLGFVNLSARN